MKKRPSPSIDEIKRKIEKLEVQISQAKNKKDYCTLQKKLQEYEKYHEQVLEYQKRLAQEPKTAFFYSPFLYKDEVRELAQRQDLLTLEQIAKMFNIKQSTVIAMQHNGMLKGEKHVGCFFFDLTTEDNQKSSEALKEKRSQLIYLNDFLYRYNYSQKQANEDLKNKKLISFLNESSVSMADLIDITNEHNKKTVKEHLKFTAQPSKYLTSCQVGKALVPIQYFKNLGFPIKEIAKYMEEGLMDGYFKIIPDDKSKKIKCAVDINSPKSQAALLKIRKENPSILSKTELKNKYNLSEKEILEAILNDELEIIPTYVLHCDKTQIFFNLESEKNKSFIAKQDKKLSTRKQVQFLKSSTRLKLAFALCPELKNAQRKHSKGKWALVQLFDKDRKDLTPNEEKMLKCYLKSVWNETGTNEWEEANTKVSKLISMIDNGENPKYMDINNERVLNILEDYRSAINLLEF